MKSFRNRVVLAILSLFLFVGRAAASPNIGSGPNNLVTAPINSQGGIQTVGSILATAIGTPSAGTVLNVGTAGSTTYTYACVAQDINANETVPSATFTTTTGNATLSATNFNRVYCGGQVGAVAYRILKTDTAHKIGVCFTQSNQACSFDDLGVASTSYTAQTVDQTNVISGAQITGSPILATSVNALGNITGATSVNLSLGNVITGTLTGNVTFTFTNGTSGQHLIFILTQDATGGRTVTWPAGAAFGSGSAPSVRPEPSATDTFGFDSTSATAWQYTEGGDNPTFTNITTRVNAIGNAAATQNLDFALGGTQTLTLTQNTTLTFSNIPAAGTLVVVQATQNGTGGFTLTWPATAKFLTATAPPVNPNANGVDTFSFLSNGTNIFQYGETYNAVRGSIATPVNAQGSQASAVACNWSISNVCTATLTGNVTVTSSLPTSGGIYHMILTQDATGGRTVTLAGGTYKLPNNGTVGTNLFNQTASAVSDVAWTFDGVNFDLVSGPGMAIGGGPYTQTTAGTTVNAGVTQAQTGTTITGMTTTSTCVCTPQTLPATWQTGIQLLCVPTTNTATCQESNPTAGNLTPATITLNVKAFY